MALHIFPEEVWELVLQKLVDVTDIFNVFRAFPELEQQGVLRSKRHLWLFERMIPRLTSWLQPEDILSCRQVCRPWCRGINNFLENHPDKRAYSWDPPDELSAEGLHSNLTISRSSTSSSWRNFGVDGVKCIISEKVLTGFEQSIPKMNSLPGTRNPFVGRSIYISDLHLDMKDHGNMTTFWNSALNCLQHFGSHVWFLELRKQLMDPQQLSQLMSGILSHAPNLKSLTISYRNLNRYSVPESWEADDFDDDDDEATVTESRQGQVVLPPLPDLESLGLDYASHTPPTLIKMLVMGYSSQIRKLKIDFRHWRRDEYSRLFPNLTEFTVVDIKIVHVKDTLQALECPRLYSLNLEVGYDRNRNYVGENAIISWLKPFPRLNSFDLFLHFCCFEGGEETLSLPRDSITSLKSFKIAGQHIGAIKLGFLKCLPSLEYLDITYSCVWNMNYLNKNLYYPNVWELLRKLKKVRVTPRDRFLLNHYTREQYDWGKREKEIRVKGQVDLEGNLKCFDAITEDSWEE